MRVRNKELRRRWHRKEQRILELKREAISGSKPSAPKASVEKAAAKPKAPVKKAAPVKADKPKRAPVAKKKAGEVEPVASEATTPDATVAEVTE